MAGPFSLQEVLMAFAEILVHMDQTICCGARLGVAIDLAKRFNARLTGLYVITHQFYQPRYGRAEAAAQAVRRMFDGQCASAGIDSLWQCIDWSVIGVGMTEIINNHAHYTDLLIVGQSYPGTTGRRPAGADRSLCRELSLGRGAGAGRLEGGTRIDACGERRAPHPETGQAG
jgi:nucleotide-binding universal stress UspA family protein